MRSRVTPRPSATGKVRGEETTDPGLGYCFDVGKEHGDPTPLKDMGRFSHEAVMVDPRTGYEGRPQFVATVNVTGVLSTPVLPPAPRLRARRSRTGKRTPGPPQRVRRGQSAPGPRPASATRSSSENIGSLPGFAAIATTTLSKRRLARRTMP